MNKVKILFFATLKDRAGTAKADLEIPDSITVAELKELLFQRFPDLPKSKANLLVAVNKEYAFDQEQIPQGAEIALFPPVSGGSEPPTIFSITKAELDLNAILAQITLPTTGAACFFSGVVRGITSRGKAHETVHLEYEAYVPMAEAKMRQVTDEIRQRWPRVEGIAIVQRVGVLQPGTPTVLIACTAAHRDTGVFEAARYGIDRLKEIVPIWKKEVKPGGEEWIEGEYTPSAKD
ncbi:MAG: molybdopterin converting factor subunit 1 [Chloroflexi bacterium]|nr:molybdopterin converting factor subunit 1 [Chloroflexota bacterium]